MKLTAVLFDMDGVIVNTEPLHKKAYYQMFEKVGVEVESALFESFTGQTTHFVCKQLKEKFALNHTIEEMISLVERTFPPIINCLAISSAASAGAEMLSLAARFN